MSYDPNKTLPPVRITYAELEAKLDEFIGNALMPSFAQELIAKLDEDPSNWVCLNWLQLDPRPYEEGR